MTSLQKQIVELIEKNRNFDTMDICIELNTPVLGIYREVNKLQEAGVLKKNYIGIRTYYTIEK